jgi:pimeloyl-ACP methyl ester carboxylesterase
MQNILLVHGFMLTPHVWDDITDDLSALGNLYFADLTHDDTIDAMAERVLSQAPETFYLFGFSMGGFVAQAIIDKAPERVLGLVLLNTSAKPVSEQERAILDAQIAMAEKTAFKGLTSRALMSAVHPDRRQDKALLDRLQAMALANGKAVFLQQLAALRSGCNTDLTRITCPVMIVASDTDQLKTVADAQSMADRIPQAELVIIHDSGHMTQIEAATELVEHITTWMQQHAS